MSETSERYRKVTEQFGERLRQVPPDAWGNPAPCEGWVTRDVVRHMIDTSAYFLSRAGVAPERAPSVDDDPVAAWESTREAVLAALDDPAKAGQEYDTPMGTFTFERTVATFGIPDVVVHTWDLARAAGIDDRLDPAEVHRIFEAMKPLDEGMRRNGVFGPKVEVPDDADEQSRFIAFTGRRP